MIKNLNKLLTFLALLSFGIFFAQNRSLEMGKITGDGNPGGNGPVLTTAVNLLQNTDNPAGNTFVNYTPNLKVTYTISNPRYPTSVNNSPLNMGAAGGAASQVYAPLNTFGAPIDGNFTASGATVGNGISVTNNYAAQFVLNPAPLRAVGAATNGTYAMADLTVTFNRAVNNPVIHLGGLGGTRGALGFAARFDLTSSNVPLANLSLTRLSGNNATGFQVTGKGIFNGSATLTASGATSGSGSVEIAGTGITSLTFTVSIRGDGGTAATTAWAANDTDLTTGDAFTVGFSTLESDLQITKTVNNATATVGSNVVFTLLAKNNGASNTAVSVNDILPSGFQFVSSSNPGSYNSVTGVWTIGALASNASSTLTITAKVLATGNYTNTATISTTSGITDPVAANNTASATVTAVTPQSDLQLTKSVDKPSAPVGDNVAFTIVATNNGPVDNTGVSVTDLLPNGFQYDSSATPTGTTYDSVTGIWTIGALTSGQSRTLQIYAKVNATGNYTNTATISTTSGITDPNAANNTASAIVAIVCVEPVGGDTFTWTFPDGTPSPVTQTLTQPGTNAGFVFDIYGLDNSFNMEINGVKLAQYEIEFQSNGTPAPGINIEFADGDQYETNTGGDIWQMAGTALQPLIRVSISATGVVSMYGSKVSGGALFPLKFKQGITPVNYFNTITWNPITDNTIVVTQNVVGVTRMDGKGYGQNIVPCITACYEDPQTTGTLAPTNHGITLLQRAGVNNGNWPMLRNGGHTALESNNKGFVVTRMPKADLGNITNPIDGMMVYDITDQCLKIYTTDSATPINNGWKCFTTPACP